MDGGKQIGEGVFELPVRVAAYKTTNSIIKPEIAAAAGIIKHVSRRNKGSRASANSDKEVLAEDKNKFKEFLKKIIQGIKDWFF